MFPLVQPACPASQHSHYPSSIFSLPHQSHKPSSLHLPPLSSPSLSSPPLLRLCLRKWWSGHPAQSLSALPALTPSWPPCRTHCTSASCRASGAASLPISSSRNAPPLPLPATPPFHYHQTLPLAPVHPVAGNCRPFQRVLPTPSFPLLYALPVPSFSRWWAHHSPIKQTSIHLPLAIYPLSTFISLFHCV